MKTIMLMLLAATASAAPQAYGKYPEAKKKSVISDLSIQGFTDIETICSSGLCTTTYDDGQPAVELTPTKPSLRSLNVQLMDVSTPTLSGEDPAADEQEFLALFAKAQAGQLTASEHQRMDVLFMLGCRP